MNRLRPLFSLLAALSLVACARGDRSPPLPGDSVAADGAVSIASPRLVTNVTGAPASAPNTHEPLSAIEIRLFPAELIMDHQAEIALTPAQREAITKELDKSQSELVKLQWELQSEKDKLVVILGDTKVDEAKSHQAAASLMQRENAIKSAHLDLLVRIKNVLTAEQQEKLRAIRQADRCTPAPPLASPNDAGHD
jgi:Spy/CpxP family protein refolding chaperone